MAIVIGVDHNDHIMEEYLHDIHELLGTTQGEGDEEEDLLDNKLPVVLDKDSGDLRKIWRHHQRRRTNWRTYIRVAEVEEVGEEEHELVGGAEGEENILVAIVQAKEDVGVLIDVLVGTLALQQGTAGTEIA